MCIVCIYLCTTNTNNISHYDYDSFGCYYFTVISGLPITHNIIVVETCFIYVTIMNSRRVVTKYLNNEKNILSASGPFNQPGIMTVSASPCYTVGEIPKPSSM